MLVWMVVFATEERQATNMRPKQKNKIFPIALMTGVLAPHVAWAEDSVQVSVAKTNLLRELKKSLSHQKQNQPDSLRSPRFL